MVAVRGSARLRTGGGVAVQLRGTHHTTKQHRPSSPLITPGLQCRPEPQHHPRQSAGSSRYHLQRHGHAPN